MNTFTKINDFFLFNKTKTQSPSSKRPDTFFQLSPQSPSDDTINTLSSSRSLPQTIQPTHQMPRPNHPVLPKDNGIVRKHPNNMKNNAHQKNYITTDMKRKDHEVQLNKTRNLVSPGSYRSHEESGSKPEGFTGGFIGKNVQWNRDFQGRTEEIRVNEETLRPIEPNDPMKGACKGAGGQERDVVKGEDFLKIITEGRLKEEGKGKFQIEFSDISEATSEIWCPNGTVTQPKKVEVASIGSKFQENTKPKVIQVNKQEIDGIRVMNNNQGKGIGFVGVSGNGFMEQLKKFPLKELTITKKGNFDKRYKLTQSYLDLCEKANQDPLRYYHENCKKEQQVIVQSVQERNKLKEASDEEEDVLEELEEFPLGELVITKKGFFDKRYKLTQQYLELCEKAGQDPLEYYHENME